MPRRYHYNRKGRLTGYSSSTRQLSLRDFFVIGVVVVAGLLVMRWSGFSDAEDRRRTENENRFRAEHCGKGDPAMDSHWPCAGAAEQQKQGKATR